MVGSRVSHYQVISELGRGGMGAVYLAEDTTLHRRVALKFIAPDLRPLGESEARLLREARSASALDHPNIATIYEVGEWEGEPFIVMAYYDGETLARRLQRGRVPPVEAATLLLQVAEGLARAHAAGVVHRDLKPSNIMLTRDGPIKILDFGLAKQESAEVSTATRLTAPGTTLGTVAYMSPEQARGDHTDHRADLWALGVIAYEMLTGRRPFEADHPTSVLHAIIYEAHPDLRSTAPHVPEPLRQIVDKALQKEKTARYQTPGDVIQDLNRSRAVLVPEAATVAASPRFRRPIVAVLLIAAFLLMGALAFRALRQIRSERWAREEAIPEVGKLVEVERFADAFRLAARAEAVVPGDPTLARLRQRFSRSPDVLSDPTGAAVSYGDYTSADAEWTRIGVTPIDHAAMPLGYYRWRFEKPGYEPTEVSGFTGAPVITAALVPSNSSRVGMVAVPGTPDPRPIYMPGFEHLPPVSLAQTFYIDKYEVTNRQFKAFVDAGGYRRREYWTQAFVDGNRALTWAEAMRRFRDETGTFGPATWIQGEYPVGQDDFPVRGVSWFEASAYARFAGKQLPTIHHWVRAAEPRVANWIVPISNMASKSPVAVGTRNAVHVSGAHDMAGNVKEWVATDTGSGKRYILGGGWDEPAHVFAEPDARSPFDRGATFGFRCAVYAGALPEPVTAPVAWSSRDYSSEKPASDDVFEVYRRLYAYDRVAMKGAPVAVDDTDQAWRREMVTLPAPYGNEEMKLFLYLPKRVAPPLQTVLYFPGAGMLRTRSFDLIPVPEFDFVIKSGRAVAFPILKGTFDRATSITNSVANPSVDYRDHVLAWIKDARRAIDYMETRADLTVDRLAFFGFSWGGRMGTILPALDDRIKVAVLVAGGFSMQRPHPEVDQIHFARRVRIPVLMLNGRYDFVFPVDASQKPMFETLATPAANKRHVLFDGGHGIPRVDLIRETLNWLDRYQGAPDR